MFKPAIQYICRIFAVIVYLFGLFAIAKTANTIENAVVVLVLVAMPSIYGICDMLTKGNWRWEE